MLKSFVRAFGLVALTLAASACGANPLAEHRATAAAVLERAGGGDIFVDASTADFAAIRHAPSGMLCVLPSDGAFDLQAFPASAANPGASCSAANGGVATLFVAVRFEAVTSLDRAFAEALAATAGQASPIVWTGEPSAADTSSPEGLPHFRIARFEVAVDGAPGYLRVAMSEARGWYLQQIVSAPLERAEAAEAAAGEAWRQELRAFVEAPATAP